MFGGQDDARRAIAALRAALHAKAVLQSIKFATVGNALDRGDLGLLVRYREHKARHLRFAVYQHGAGATARIVAAALGASQAQILTEDLEQQSVRFDLQLVHSSIDV